MIAEAIFVAAFLALVWFLREAVRQFKSEEFRRDMERLRANRIANRRKRP